MGGDYWRRGGQGTCPPISEKSPNDFDFSHSHFFFKWGHVPSNILNKSPPMGQAHSIGCDGQQLGLRVFVT